MARGVDVQDRHARAVLGQCFGVAETEAAGASRHDDPQPLNLE